MENNVLGKYVNWIKITFLVFTIMFLGIFTILFVFYYLSNFTNNILLGFSIFVGVVALLFLAGFIYFVIRKVNAISAVDNKIILKDYKSREIDINEVKEVKYTYDRMGLHSFTHALKTGTIEFHMKNMEVISITEIKDVRIAVANVRNYIYVQKQNNKK